MAHIGLRSGNLGSRPGLSLSPLGAGLTLAAAVSAAVWAALFTLIA